MIFSCIRKGDSVSRKQKIIVSVTGIFIVLLILVGLTYAYFLTRIQGNTNTKSISVTTADLKLTYGDGNGDITAEKIQPGTIIDTKTFTVKNEGNATVNNYAVYLEELVNTLSRTSDMVYTLTCTSSVSGKTCNGVNETSFPTQNGMLVTNNIDVNETQSYELKVVYKEMNIDQSEDMNKTIGAKVQIYNLADIVDITGTVTNATTGDYVEMQSNPKTSQIRDNKYLIPAVEPGVHTLYVKDSKGTVKGSKQITINKGNEAKVNGDVITVTSDSQTISINITSISNTLTTDIGSVEDYMPFEEGTLAYNVLNNAKNKTNGTEFLKTPKTKPAEETSAEDEKVLSITPDDYGTSYYYRGSVEDNYVNFAGMCWKIVRIEGDGSTKLILEDRSVECNSSSYTGNWSDGNAVYFGYDSNDKADFLNYTGGLADSLQSFQTTLVTKVKAGKTLSDYLKVGNWCFDHNVVSTESYGYDVDGNTVYDESKATSGWYTSEYYGAYKRIYTEKNPSLVCTGTKLNKFKDDTDMYVGTLTADEMSFAGVTNSTNYSLYLMNNYAKKNYLLWWGLSIGNFSTEFGYDCAFIFNSNFGKLSDGGVNRDTHSGFYSRHALTLKSGVQISAGNGTISNPYVIE